MADEQISIDRALQMIPEIYQMLTVMNENYFKTPVVADAPTGTEDKFINAAAAAKLLGIGKNTIYHLTMRKTIPFYKTGKRLYFSANELTNYIKSNRTETALERAAGAKEYIKTQNY